MSAEENKAVVRRWYEEINKGKEAAIAGLDELFAPDLVWHGAGLFADMDLAGMNPLITALFTGFPDLHWVVEDLIAEGDKVVVRLTVRGTHQGEFMGIPPTGKQATWTGIEISRIEEHKFVEGWDSFDNLGLLQQLGAIPQMAQTGA
jgi:steroid delta-isomerase-like uncharacterized protein